MAGFGINNSEDRGKFLEGDLVGEAEVNTEASAWIKVLCGKIGGRGRRGTLEIRQDRKAWYSLGTDFGSPVNTSSLAICRTF